MLGIKNTIIAVVISLSLGWVYSQYQFKQGIDLGRDQQIALQSKVDSQVRELKEELEVAVIEGLKQITVTNKTINNKAIREVLTKEVYKECVVPQEGKDVIKQALEPRK